MTSRLRVTTLPISLVYPSVRTTWVCDNCLMRFTALFFTLATLLAACSSPGPTPTPPYGLPPLTLPADESPHDFQTEWWYFNVHLTDENGGRLALHDVVFQVQELASGRTLYVRQVGLADGATGTHAVSERISREEAPLSTPSGAFALPGDGAWMEGSGGRYRLTGNAGGVAFDLRLAATSDAVLHDDDGLVDFGEAGVTYYYSRPRLQVTGEVVRAGDTPTEVTGLGWLDKQWGNFQPVVVSWDWASVQLDDGTDLMLSRLLNVNGGDLDTYATLREPGGDTRRLDADAFTFLPGDAAWTSPRTGTRYLTDWRVIVPSAGIDVTLQPLLAESEFPSATLGVTYWEAGVDVVDRDGNVVGQGFVELNWPRGSSPVRE